MGKYKINKTTNIEKNIFYYPCIECGCDDINVYNAGYSTFNVGNVTCKECGNVVDIRHMKWDDTDESLIGYWNEYNDPVKRIAFYEREIKERQEKIEKYKLRLPKLKVNLEHNIILTCSNCNHDNQEYINKTSFVNYGHKDVPSYMWDYIRKCDCCGEKLDINIYVFLSDEYTLDKTVVGGKGFDVGKLKEFLSDKLITI